jgi:UDP-N-acetylmuramoylalanine--D-glutamate ligase
MTRGRLDLDALTLDDVRRGALHGRRVTVLGFARSGIALARFFADAGGAVTVYDARSADALGDAIAALEGRVVRLLLGPDVDPAMAWLDADLVATSPSINPDYPTTEPRLRRALAALRDRRAKGDRDAPPIASEPDLVLRLCPVPTVGVTGTKGKTTTASLIVAVLAVDEAHPVALGGNIGDPLVDRLVDLTADHRVVMELSELQLPTLSRGTTVAVYTNVTADHLDRHGSLEAYRRVKRRLAELVDSRGALVLNADDPVVAEYAGLTAATTVLYRTERPSPGGVGLVDGWIVAAGVGPLALAGRGAARAERPGPIMPVDELAIPGRHNISNALAAVAVGLLFGLAPDAIRRAVAGFRGVEHRLELVAEIDGVRFVNDSQGTQPDAVIAALNAFERPVILIAGGRDKDVDLTALAGVVGRRADAAVLIGESAPMLERLFRHAGLARIERAPTLDAAVAIADRLARQRAAELRAARPGASGPATVLLSPAATSFDMFVDYAARGRAFKAAVADLARRHRSAAEGQGRGG